MNKLTYIASKKKKTTQLLTCIVHFVFLKQVGKIRYVHTYRDQWFNPLRWQLIADHNE